MTATKEQIKGALEALRAVADTIRELKQVPSGTLYAQLMGVMSLETYDKIIGTLKRAGLVAETQSHLLVWIEPEHDYTPPAPEPMLTKESLMEALKPETT